MNLQPWTFETAPIELIVRSQWSEDKDNPGLFLVQYGALFCTYSYWSIYQTYRWHWWDGGHAKWGECATEHRARVKGVQSARHYLLACRVIALIDALVTEPPLSVTKLI